MDIKIKAIHGLKKIQFYSINNNLNYIGCEITCSNGTYSYNYKDECFHDFVSRVIEVYDREKNNNILLIGELTKKILLEKKITNNNYSKYNNKNNVLYTKCINENKLRDYIYLIIISLAKHNNLNNLRIDSINKLKNKYLITCVEPFMKIPVEIFDYDNNNVFFNLKFDEIYSCKLTFNYDSETIEAKTTSDKYLFSEFNINGNNYIQINKDNNVLYYNEYDCVVSDIENKLIKNYTNIIGVNDLLISKTIFNNYLLNNEITNSDNEVKINKMAINISGDKVNIKYFESLKYKLQNILLPYYNMYHDINIIMIDNEHLLMQDKVDEKYKYTLIHISKINNLFDDFDIINKFDINEDIKYKSDVIKLIK